MHGDLNSYQLELQQFNLLVEEGRGGIYGRAHAWINTTLFDLGRGLREFRQLYEHCLCLATNVVDAKVQSLLKAVRSKYKSHNEHKASLIKDIERLRDKIQPFLF